MPENPPSLTDQLASRLKLFAQNLGLSQVKLARLLEMDQGQLSRFLDGKVGLSAEMTLKIVRLTSLSKRELDLKFGEKITSKILHLQEAGKPIMKLDWVPGQSGSDPNDSTDITGVGTARDEDCASDYIDEITDFFRGQQEIYRSAISAIDDYFNNIKAKVNQGPTTEGTRQVTDNADSSRPGPRSDKFELKADPKRLLTIYAEAKAEAEEQLQLAQDIEAAREGAIKARANLAAFKK